ncbi:MAG: CHAP domain-containing protein [Flavobacteriia bacterium]|nr:CHAP domain-containing protein [Flavobacteriia bacterium]
MKKLIVFIFILIITLFGCFFLNKKLNVKSKYKQGQKIDSLNHVLVFYNDGMNSTSGRNLTVDNYNLGLKYQCVEFVKRYYYEYYHHKMPNSFGNAKDFFNPTLNDGALNKDRNLIQFSNGSKKKPQIGDLLVLDATSFNQFGHVAIISDVTADEIEIIQQNTSHSRDYFDCYHQNNKWFIDNDRILGWLRKDDL